MDIKDTYGKINILQQQSHCIVSTITNTEKSIYTDAGNAQKIHVYTGVVGQIDQAVIIKGKIKLPADAESIGHTQRNRSRQ